MDTGLAADAQKCSNSNPCEVSQNVDCRFKLSTGDRRADAGNFPEPSGTAAESAGTAVTRNTLSQRIDLLALFLFLATVPGRCQPGTQQRMRPAFHLHALDFLAIPAQCTSARPGPEGTVPTAWSAQRQSSQCRFIGPQCPGQQRPRRADRRSRLDLQPVQRQRPIGAGCAGSAAALQLSSPGHVHQRAVDQRLLGRADAGKRAALHQAGGHCVPMQRRRGTCENPQERDANFPARPPACCGHSSSTITDALR